jgi:hypothetical protein
MLRDALFIPARVIGSASLLLLGSLAACQPSDDDAAADGTDDEDTTGETDGSQDQDVTWWRDVEPIVRDRCGCHQDGDIAPFSLETHAEFTAFASLAGDAIESGEMPPWGPDPDCNSYRNPRSLTAEQEEILLSYIAGDMPEGDPADASPPVDPPAPFVPDIEIEMLEAFTPSSAPDDYRCFLIPWPADITQDRYVTGFDIEPGEPSIVHHVIVFMVPPGQLDAFTALDDAEPGPGYTCFGGPGGPPGSVDWLGAWVPSLEPFVAPAGVGQRVPAGSTLIAQIHYNSTPGNTLSDRTTIGVTIEPTVERRAVVTPLADIAWLAGNGAMSIPAGDPDVTHEATFGQDFPLLANVFTELGVAPGTALDVWNAGLHLHLLGSRGRIAINQDAGEACLLDVPDWDFHWQSSYDFVDPARFGPDDEIRLQCWWDNSAENQPIVDGQQLDPIDRDWGEGTLDEMCLGILYFAVPED